MFEKVGFWGSVASIISLALVFLLPLETADSQDKHGNRVEVHGSVSGDAFGGDKINGDKVNGDKFSGDKVNGDKVNGDKFSGDKVNGDKVNGDKIINQSSQIDPQLRAQGMRVVAETSRAAVQGRVGSPFPKKWLDAERSLRKGNNLYAKSDFGAAYDNFNAAFRLYTDLRSAIVHQ